MDAKTLQYYLSKAKKAKEEVKSFYNEVLEFTELSYKIEDSANKNTKPNEIDTIIPMSLSNLVSFLMSSMVSRSTKWATISMNEKLYKLVNPEEEYELNQSIVELNRNLENISDITYTYLNQSNYYSEIAKALRECVNIGTGAYRVSERDKSLTPFVFQYIPQDDLFYWEDSLGRPVYIFKYIRDINGTGLKTMFGDKIKIPSVITDMDEDKVTVIETITPVENEDSKFDYVVYDESFANKIYEIQLEYCPIVIFRWNKEGNNPNGLGLSLQGLKTFKALKEAVEKRAESADKLLRPPLEVKGDRALAQSLSLKANAVNYTGTATSMGAIPSQTQDVLIRPIATVGNLLPLDQDIINYKAEIKELYQSNPVGQIDDYKRRSALESQIRLNALRQKYALSFEILERELLMPTFLTPLRILIKKKKIEFNPDDLDLTLIVYKNSLALNQEMQNVDMVMQYMQFSSQALQLAQSTGLKPDKVLRYFQNNLGVPMELAMSDDEIGAMIEQQQQAQANMAQTAEQMTQNRLREQELELNRAKFEQNEGQAGMV